MRVTPHLRVLRLLPVLVVLAGAVACGGRPAPTPVPSGTGGRLLVLVRNGSGLPLAGATVSVVGDGAAVRTDPRGQATLPARPGVTVQVHSELAGYVATQQAVAHVDPAVSTAVRVTMPFVPPSGAFVQRVGPFDADQLVITTAMPPTATLIHYDYSCNLARWRVAKRSEPQAVTWSSSTNEFLLGNGNPLAVVSAPGTIDSRWAAAAPETLTAPVCPTPTPPATP